MPHTSKSGPRAPKSTRTRRALGLAGAAALLVGAVAAVPFTSALAADGAGPSISVNTSLGGVTFVGDIQSTNCDTQSPQAAVGIVATNTDTELGHTVYVLVGISSDITGHVFQAGLNDPENPDTITLSGTNPLYTGEGTPVQLRVDTDGESPAYLDLGYIQCPTPEPTPEPTPTTEPTTEPTPEPTVTPTPTPEPTVSPTPTPEPTTEPSPEPTTPPSTGGGGTTNPPSTGNPPSAGGGSETDNTDTTKSSGRKGGATDGQDGVFESGTVNLTLPDEDAEPSAVVEASNSQAPQPAVPMWLVWAFGGLAAVLLALWAGPSLVARSLKKGS